MSKIYGYIRVDTKEQNEERQVLAMREVNIPPGNLFVDWQSGKDFQRPAYQSMIAKMEQNDLLYSFSLGYRY